MPGTGQMKQSQRYLYTLAMLSVAVLLHSSLLSAADVKSIHSLERRVHEKINAERQEHGLNILLWNDSLAGVARIHAENMAHRRFFSHTDPEKGDLSQRLDKAGIAWLRCSENIYREKGLRDPAADVVKVWLKSPGHRTNMLDLWMVESGVGAAMQADGTWIIVQAYLYPDY